MKRKNNLRKVCISFFLLVLWFILTLWYIIIFDNSLLVLSHNYSGNNFIELSHNKLIKGEKLSGEFIAKEENLGIVALRFERFQRIPYDQEDVLVFRLKEKGAEEWYYENEYRSGLTYDVPFLPFGFPIIPDSQGRTYVFELESLRGNPQNGVVLSEREPVLVSKHQKDREKVLSSFNDFFVFGYTKFFNSLNTIDVFYSSFVFFLPLFFYLVWISPIKDWFVSKIGNVSSEIDRNGTKILGEKKYILLTQQVTLVFSHWMIIVLVGALLVDILFLQVSNDLLYFSIITIWFILMKVYRKDDRMSYVVSLFLLLIAPIALEYNNVGIAEKAGAWAFMFLFVGMIQSFIKLVEK